MRTYRRLFLAAASTAVLGVVLCTVLTVRWFLHPATTEPERVDAVVVLAGGTGERFDTGMRLIEAGVSDTLVLSTGITWFLPESRPVHELCARPPQDVELHCVAAVPDSTEGEAEDISQLADEQGWHSLAVVTSSYHLTRSMRWFGRCFDGELYGVAAPADAAAADVHVLRAVRQEDLGPVAERIGRGGAAHRTGAAHRVGDRLEEIGLRRSTARAVDARPAARQEHDHVVQRLTHRCEVHPERERAAVAALRAPDVAVEHDLRRHAARRKRDRRDVRPNRDFGPLPAARSAPSVADS